MYEWDWYVSYWGTHTPWHPLVEAQPEPPQQHLGRQADATGSRLPRPQEEASC